MSSGNLPREHTLPNGLKVALAPMPHLHTAVAAIYLRVGSRYESRATNGISHFLEHMVFRGTESLPSAHAQSLAFERLGSTLYAATQVDRGVMSVVVPPSNLGAVLALLGEVTRAPRFTEIEIERGIVREEILEDLDDEGRQVDADNLARELMFPDHPLGYTITGDERALEGFDEAALRAHHARHYVAENACVSIAGKIEDLDACLREVEEHFGALPRGERVIASPPPPAQRRARSRFVTNPSSQTELRVTFRAPHQTHPLEPVAELLLRVIDDGMSTRLYERICDKKGLCYDVSAIYEAYEDDGVIDFAAGSQHARSLTVVREILDLIHELSVEGPTETEVQKALARHRWTIDAMSDDPDAVASFYGVRALEGTRLGLEERHAQLASVSREQMRDFAAEWLAPERMNVLAVGMLSAADQRRLDKLVRGVNA